jgi:hypothetical protein
MLAQIEYPPSSTASSLRSIALRALAGLLAVLSVPSWVCATESGIGRPITGAQIAPYAGVVPAASAWIVSLNTIYYEGSLGANKTLPIAGTVTAGLDYNIVYVQANLIKSWGITSHGWNFASSIGVPVQYTDISSFHGRLPNDHATQFADLFVVPVIAGYHFTKTDHVALSLQLYAPTGAYDARRLANAGQNTWTFIPTVAYTKLLPAEELELSVNYGVEFYTPNGQTGYHNAPVSVLDVLALRRFKGGWGVGVVGGWIQQLGDDTGGLANVTGGASGYAVGLGPMLTYAGKLDKTPVSASLRWVNELAAHNRPKGNAVTFAVNASFE